MPRPTLVGLALLLGGCQLLPVQTDPCPQSGECPPYVQTPFVLGQPDATTNWLQTGFNLNQNAGILLVPAQPAGSGMAATPQRLVVADSGNNRVLIWNLPLSQQYNQAPDITLGAQDRSSLNYGDYLHPASYIPNPTHLASNDQYLVVASDPNPNQTELQTPLLYFSWATINKYVYGLNSAYLQLGQSPLANGTTVDNSHFNGPSPLYTANALYVSDRVNNRVLVFSPLPTPSNPPLPPNIPAAPSAVASTILMPIPGLKSPQGPPASDGAILLVPDTKNNRVIGYNPLPTVNAAPNIIIASPTLSLSSPTGVALSTTGGVTALAIADTGNSRVLLWNNFDKQNPNILPDTVLADSGGLMAASLRSPTSVVTDGNLLAVADSGNNRILVWTSWPGGKQPLPAADFILGQPDPGHTSSDGEYASASKLMSPVAITQAGGQFIVSDAIANRVLIWPQFPTDNSALPKVVLGQPNMTSTSIDGANISASSLYSPAGVASDGSVLAVADTNDNRVLLWKSIPDHNQQPADVVLGQPSPATNDKNHAGLLMGLAQPESVCISGGRLYVADTGNSRVLIWKTIPTQNQQADIVLGQANLNSLSPNRAQTSPPRDATTLAYPSGVYADDSHIYVSDSANLRVLIWNTLDPANGQAADIVLGAANFNAYGSLYSPANLQTYKGHLYLAYAGNNEIAVWNTIPTQNNLPIDTFLGQEDKSGFLANMGGISTATLQRPTGILVTNIGTYIADYGNGRIVALPPTN